MDNMTKYLKWRSDLSFSKCKLNEVDFALFSQVVMIPYKLYIDMPEINTNDSCTMYELALLISEKKENFIKNMGLIMPPQLVDVIIKMGLSNRYKDLVIRNYESQIDVNKEVQFTALTIDLDENTRVVVYSGTDDTVIGWKEDFNMMFAYPTEAQSISVKYLKRVYENKKLYITGHSKGGNLCLYSALNIKEEIFKDIIKVYCYDAPGLNYEFENEKEIKQRSKKILEFVPQTSIIGALFNHYGTEIVVKSNYLGLYQHDLLSWEVDVDSFLKVETRDNDSIYIENKLKKMLVEMEQVTKEEFVEVGYGVFMRTNSETLTDVYNNKVSFVKEYLNIKKEEKRMMEKILSSFIVDKIVLKNIYQVIKETFDKTKEKKKYLKDNENK